ncbi:MAG: PD-(D/E)XK nuclease family protein [Polyangiaceae bacterium]|nr:PD-(D/E)XK nuclease family protein [Polyangiaceae bacterium]
MEARSLYRLTGPTAWAEPPERFSYSSLKRMGACLRQWQLATSSYGDLARYPERMSEPAEVGIIAHDLLSRLFRAMALAGHPPIGSEPFRAAVARVDLLGAARAMLADVERRAVASPRAPGFRLQATARDVYNKVSQAFRSEYASVAAQAAALPALPSPAPDPAAAAEPAPTADRLELLVRQGVLSEEEVRHPGLPLRGFIDLLVRRQGRTTVLDFKTGAAHDEHRDQLLLYALMWWRSTGDLPATIELRYGARVVSWPVSEPDLVRAEREVSEKIERHRAGLRARPAAATVGPACAGCAVRQLCAEYWSAPPSGRSGDRADLELVVEGSVTKTGLMGRTRGGQEIALVFEEAVALSAGPFPPGARLRILGAQREAGAHAFRIPRGAEVFHLP